MQNGNDYIYKYKYKIASNIKIAEKTFVINYKK